MQQGWIKLHRKITDSCVFDNPNILKVWIWCLCKATHTEHEVIVGKKIVRLLPGQFVFGRLKAAEVLRMNDRTVYDYMKLLENLNMLQMNPNNKYTLVTVVNWAFYQCDDSELQQQNTQQYTIKETQQNTIENHTYKNDKKEKNVRKVFIIPSVDEVRKYCDERQNDIDAEAFIDFYESNGWMVGKNKMKNWKAAVRTWERNKQKKGSKYNEVNAKQRTVYENFGL